MSLLDTKVSSDSVLSEETLQTAIKNLRESMGKAVVEPHTEIVSPHAYAAYLKRPNCPTCGFGYMPMGGWFWCPKCFLPIDRLGDDEVNTDELQRNDKPR